MTSHDYMLDTYNGLPEPPPAKSVRELARQWASFLRLMKPSIDQPDTRGGKMITEGLRQEYGNWLLVLLHVDGPVLCAARLANMGIPCPMDATSAY